MYLFWWIVCVCANALNVHPTRTYECVRLLVFLGIRDYVPTPVGQCVRAYVGVCACLLLGPLRPRLTQGMVQHRQSSLTFLPFKTAVLPSPEPRLTTLDVIGWTKVCWGLQTVSHNRMSCVCRGRLFLSTGCRDRRRRFGDNSITSLNGQRQSIFFFLHPLFVGLRPSIMQLIWNESK